MLTGGNGGKGGDGGVDHSGSKQPTCWRRRWWRCRRLCIHHHWAGKRPEQRQHHGWQLGARGGAGDVGGSNGDGGHGVVQTASGVTINNSRLDLRWRWRRRRTGRYQTPIRTVVIQFTAERGGRPEQRVLAAPASLARASPSSTADRLRRRHRIGRRGQCDQQRRQGQHADIERRNADRQSRHCQWRRRQPDLLADQCRRRLRRS